MKLSKTETAFRQPRRCKSRDHQIAAVKQSYQCRKTEECFPLRASIGERVNLGLQGYEIYHVCKIANKK